MKKGILVCFLILVSFVFTSAQTTYSCAYRQSCAWSEATETYIDCIGHEENSLFELDKAQTVIVQTMQSVGSIYRVQSKERDKRKGVTIYFVLNEAGDKFYYILNPKMKEVRIVSKKDGKSILQIFSQSNPEQKFD